MQVSIGFLSAGHSRPVPGNLWYRKGDVSMNRIQTLETRDLAKSVQTGGCGECQTSCQSACKTSCGVANQMCEHKNDEK